MKKELKRYTLCEYVGSQTRYFNNYQDYVKLLALLDGLNKKGKNQFYFGNISCELVNGLYEVTVHIYNRLTPKMTISDIDALTCDKTEEEVAESYSGLIRTVKPFKPDLNIMYFEEKNSNERDEKTVVKRIKYTPVLYKQDNRFLDQNFICDCIRHMAYKNDINFFKEMLNEFCVHHIISENVEKIRKEIAAFDRGEGNCARLGNLVILLYNSLILERNSNGKLYYDEKGNTQISRRRLRDFGFFVRDYMTPLRKKNSPMRYNKQLTQNQLEKIQSVEGKKLEKKKELPNAEQLKLF